MNKITLSNRNRSGNEDKYKIIRDGQKFAEGEGIQAFRFDHEHYIICCFKLGFVEAELHNVLKYNDGEIRDIAHENDFERKTYQEALRRAKEILKYSNEYLSPKNNWVLVDNTRFRERINSSGLEKSAQEGEI